MHALEYFEKYLRTNSDLKSESIQLVSSFFSEENLPCEKALVKQGGKYRKLVFVAQGFLRVFVKDSQGEEVIKNFIQPNDFFAELECWEKDLPAVIGVSAITHCKIMTITKADSDRLAKELPKWELHVKEGAMRAMNEMIKQQSFLRMGSAVDQYRHFVEHHPQLAQQLPLKYIASYLGVTQSSLSRIRKQAW